jgi:GR25 family glycosyltransferase involved in LPS biosynthesis
MPDINEAFPHKFCINLDRRPERWEQMRSKFERCGVRGVERFAAVDGQQALLPANWSDSPGAYGCLRSHLEIIKEARRLGWPSVLIFEDDAALDPELSEKFSSYFQQVPADWEMLHFGGKPYGRAYAGFGECREDYECEFDVCLCAQRGCV